MPKVTLLAEPWADYTFNYGKGEFSFEGGKPKNDVPVAVALKLQKKMKKNGTPLFKVEKLPRIVKRKEAAPVVPQLATEKQNAALGEPQLRLFDPCLLNAA